MRSCSFLRTPFIAGFGLLLIASGCSRRASKTIAIIPETTAQELWESEHAGAEAAILGTRWKVYWNGPSSEDDVEQQIKLVQKVIDSGDRGLILSPDHAIALTTVVHRAIAKGIPAVITGTSLPVPPGPDLVYILDDDLAAGRIAADRVGQILGGKGEVCLIGSSPDITSTMKRASSFENEIKNRFPKIRILRRFEGSFRLGEAEQNTEEALRSAPKLKAIVSIGITSTRGAYIALKTTNRISDVRLIGFDQDLDLMYYLRRGEIDSIVAQNTYQMGYQAVEDVLKLIGGHRVPRISRVEPVLITQHNLDQPQIQSILTMNWRPSN